MLYALTEMDSFTQADLANFWNLLSEQRKSLVNRRKFFSDKRQSALAYLLLRYALVTEFQVFEAVEFHSGTYGKPFLEEFPEIHFNLSHSKKGVVCGVSASPIGIDIADIDMQNLDCIFTALHPNEQIAVQESENPAKTFARFWASKESFLKFKGTGISKGLAELDFSTRPDFLKPARMQVWELEFSIICHCGLQTSPMHFLKKSDLSQILIGE